MKDTVYYIPVKNAGRLRESIYHACALYVFVSIIGAVMLYLYSSSLGSGGDPGKCFMGLPRQVYLVRFLIIPMVPSLFGLFTGHFRIFSENSPTRDKNKAVLYLLFLVTAIPYIFYFNYPSLIVGPCICSFICILFAEKHMVTKIYIASILSVILNLAGSFRDRCDTLDFIPESIVALTAFTITFFISRTLTMFQMNYYAELQKETDEKDKLDKDTKLDPFTGLYNKKELFALLTEEINKRKSMYTPLYFCIFDIDNFKQVNDTYGHPTGDIVLLAFCSIIKEYLPSGCYASRYGGEEFAVILPSLSGQEAYRVAESIRMRFMNTQFDFLESSKRRSITVSCGLVTYRDKQGSADALFASADTLLYEAKNSGKNKTIFR